MRGHASRQKQEEFQGTQPVGHGILASRLAKKAI